MRRVQWLGLLLLFTACWTQADQVHIPVSQQPGADSVERPAAGMKKTSVAQAFGDPIQRKGPVGDPAISSWEYSDYVVYFENDTVLRSVVKHQPESHTY